MKNRQSKIRVLHLFANLNFGGAESRIMDFYRTQNDSNVINDFVIMTNEKCYFSDEVLSTGGIIHTIDNPRDGLLITLKQLYFLLRKKPRYDAIHSHTSYFSGIVVFIGWLAGINKRITQAHTQGLGHVGQSKGFMFEVGSMLCKTFATTRFAVSSNAGDFLYGITPYKLVALSFDFSSFMHVHHEKRTERRQALGILDNTINIISVARFCIVKNHSFMLSIAKACTEKGIDVHFHFIGEGEERSNIEYATETLSLQNQVRFWGSRSDVNELMSLFDVMLMPSISEGLGMTSLEAQASGLPCILSEGVPKEADLGLGLCQHLSLEQPINDWIQAILKSKNASTPSKEVTNQVFIEKGYLLDSSRKIYLEAYQ